MLWLVLLKIKLAFIALANRFACHHVSVGHFLKVGSANLIGDFLLLFSREIDEMVVLRPN